MSPTSALLLSLLLPGSAHVRLGRTATGVLALACCLGLFLAGYAILGERWYFYRLFPPMEALEGLLTFLPIHHLPDGANLPGMVVAGVMDPGSDVIAQRVVRTALESTMMENLGRFLTGASGMAAMFFASDAFFRARAAEAEPAAGSDGRPAPGLVAAASWMVPGLGHAMVGQRGKGMVMGGAVIGLFVAGVAVSAGQAVDCVMADVWWIGQNFFGGGTLLAGALAAPTTMGGSFPDGLELGINLTTCAGLANLAVILDSWSLAAGDVETVEAAPAQAAPASPEPAAVETGEG